MTSENAQRNPRSAASIQSGLHLVHSRNWSNDQRRIALVQHVIQPSRAQQAHQIRLNDTRYLAAAALVAPFVWATHALLQLLHIL